MSRRAKKAVRGKREWWSQKTLCLKQFGPHEWLRKRPAHARRRRALSPRGRRPGGGAGGQAGTQVGELGRVDAHAHGVSAVADNVHQPAHLLGVVPDAATLRLVVADVLADVLAHKAALRDEVGAAHSPALPGGGRLRSAATHASLLVTRSTAAHAGRRALWKWLSPKEHRKTSRRYVGPSCTTRFLQPMPHLLIRLHS